MSRVAPRISLFLNAEDVRMLATLPGVSPAIANMIVSLRPIRSRLMLLSIDGISEEMLHRWEANGFQIIYTETKSIVQEEDELVPKALTLLKRHVLFKAFKHWWDKSSKKRSLARKALSLLVRRLRVMQATAFHSMAREAEECRARRSQPSLPPESPLSYRSWDANEGISHSTTSAATGGWTTWAPSSTHGSASGRSVATTRRGGSSSARDDGSGTAWERIRAVWLQRLLDNVLRRCAAHAFRGWHHCIARRRFLWICAASLAAARRRSHARKAIGALQRAAWQATRLCLRLPEPASGGKETAAAAALAAAEARLEMMQEQLAHAQAAAARLQEERNAAAADKAAVAADAARLVERAAALDALAGRELGRAAVVTARVGDVIAGVREAMAAAAALFAVCAAGEAASASVALLASDSDGRRHF